MKLHTPSIFAGLGLTVLLGLTMSQNLVGLPGLVDVRVVEPVTPAQPDPGEPVRLVEGAPYTVPQGKRLVLTALGHNSLGGGVRVSLAINGTREISVWFRDDQTAGFTEMTGVKLPAPIVAAAGASVEVVGGPAEKYSWPDDGRAWGYLVDD